MITVVMTITPVMAVVTAVTTPAMATPLAVMPLTLAVKTAAACKIHLQAAAISPLMCMTMGATLSIGSSSSSSSSMVLRQIWTKALMTACWTLSTCLMLVMLTL